VAHCYHAATNQHAHGLFLAVHRGSTDSGARMGATRRASMNVRYRAVCFFDTVPFRGAGVSKLAQWQSNCFVIRSGGAGIKHFPCRRFLLRRLGRANCGQLSEMSRFVSLTYRSTNT
jgi:hypothetical protein